MLKFHVLKILGINESKSTYNDKGFDEETPPNNYTDGKRKTSTGSYNQGTGFSFA